MPDVYPRWKYYPAWRQPADWVSELVGIVETHRSELDSAEQHLVSNVVLGVLRDSLERAGYEVEGDGQRIALPALFGDEGVVLKPFFVDAFRPWDGVAIEVESGGAMENNRVLYDLIEMSLAVNVSAGALIVPQHYSTENRQFRDQYKRAAQLFDAMWANPERLRFPLEGVLLVGY